MKKQLLLITIITLLFLNPVIADGIQTFDKVANLSSSNSITIEASKIECESAEDLPRWHLSNTIDENTAEDYVANNENCTLQPNWTFQWGYGVAPTGQEKGVNELPGTHTGIADGSDGIQTETGEGFDRWKTFGPTGQDGTTTVEINTLEAYSNKTGQNETADRIWVREVLKEGYLPFSDAYSEDSPPSAEMWCRNDVRNYDNFDYVHPPQEGEIYHCVAFNVNQLEDVEQPTCDDALKNDKINISIEEGSVTFNNSLNTSYNFSILTESINQNGSEQFSQTNVTVSQNTTTIHYDAPMCKHSTSVKCTDTDVAEPEEVTESFLDKPFCDANLDCNEAIQYFQHGLDGDEVTVTVSVPNYTFLKDDYQFSLASYEKQDPFSPGPTENLYTQVLHDFDQHNISKGNMKNYEVETPQCAYQIDLVCGDPIYSFKDEGMYSDENRLLDYAHPLGNEPLCENSTYPNCKDTNYIQPHHEDNGTDWIDTESQIELIPNDNKICEFNDNREQRYAYANVNESYCKENKTHDNLTNLSFQTYEEPFNSGSEGCYAITHYTQWNFSHENNKSPTQTRYVFVDKSKPEIAVATTHSTWNASGTQYEEYCQTNECYEATNKTILTASCEDPQPHPSGVQSFMYNITKDNQTVEEGDGDDLEYSFNQSGIYNISLQCKDNVNKTRNRDLLYFYDKEINQQEISCEEAISQEDITYTVRDGNVTFTNTLNRSYNVTLKSYEQFNNGTETLYSHQNLSVSNNTETTFAYDTPMCRYRVTVACPGNQPFINESFTDKPYCDVSDNFTIHLKQKWNLISFPTTPENNSIHALFDNTTQSIWSYNAGDNEWTYANPSLPEQANTLTHVKAGQGYWIQQSQETNITFTMTNQTNTVEAKSGWNLVGYQGQTTIKSYKCPEGNGDEAQCQFHSDGISFNSLLSYWQPIGFTQHSENDKLDPGQGYWLFTNQNKTFEQTC